MSIYRPTCLLGLISLMFAAPVAAQIVPDSSVGTTITPNVEIKGVGSDRIDGGTVRGTNLFHSFSEFNIQNGRGVYFTNPEGITNIFSRITGNNASHINGILGVLGNANLFLLNPNGMIFGPNARLDLNGSFIGTSASGIQFADGMMFSAKNSTGTPLLTVNVPIGLQMEPNPGAIQVQGTGSSLSLPPGTSDFSPSPLLGAGQSTTGLRVQPGNTLALVGGEIALKGGVLSAPQGRIELGSAANGVVSLNPVEPGWSLGYGGVQSFQDIHLSQMALLDASGLGSGSIQIQGNNVTLTNSSVALIQNQGLTASGTIAVNAATSLEVAGSSIGNTIASGVRSETVGLGKAASIAISTGSLILQPESTIASSSFSPGATGDIAVSATESIYLAGSPVSRTTEGITTRTYLSGRGGEITLSTGRLTVGNAGLVSSQTYGSGQAGNINLSVRQLMLTSGGTAGSTTLGQGASGDVTVNALESVTAIGVQPVSRRPSSVSSGTVFSGKAGNVTINTRRLTLEDGSRIDSSTLTTGAAGSVTVNASESVEVTGIGLGTRSPSQIISSAVILDPALQRLINLSSALPSGNSGDVTINTGRLSIANGGRINVQNEGTGNAGTIRITAQPILLDRQGSITASTQSGEGGNINLQANSLILRHGSNITATAGGTGNGGNLTINSPTIVGLENSDIVANAFQGNGGNINITTSGIFGLENRSQLTSESDISASSQFGVSGTINVSVLNVNQQNVVAPPPSNFVSSDQVIANSCAGRQGSSQGTFAIAGNGGLPETPETASIPYQVVQVQATQTAQAIPKSPESKATPTATPNWQPGDPIIEATEFSINAQGQVVLTAKGNSATAAAIAQPHSIPCQSH